MLAPLRCNVLVEPLSPRKTTEKGIILPDTAATKQDRGTVIAVGPGYISDRGIDIRPTVQVGDVVLYTPYSGTEIEQDGKKLMIIDSNTLLAREAN